MKLILIHIILLTCFYTGCISQEENTSALNSLFVETTLSEFKVVKPHKRKLLNLKHAKLGAKLNPLTYLAAASMYVYQNLISEQISANCSYEISCSEMTKRAIEKHGLIRGSFIGIHQLSSCIPEIKKEHPEYLISPDNKIINAHFL